jgi:hypothetical protein
LDPLIPSLSSFRAHEKPLAVVSTMKAVIPLEPASGAVFAYTIIVSASGPYQSVRLRAEVRVV